MSCITSNYGFIRPDCRTTNTTIYGHSCTIGDTGCKYDIIFGFNSHIIDDVQNSIIIGNNLVCNESNQVIIGNSESTCTIHGTIKSPTIELLEQRIQQLETEINLLREMITWHPGNTSSMDCLKDHFNELAEKK